MSALDLQLRKDMQVTLKRMQKETGLTFIFVTHDPKEALTMSDRTAVMSGGYFQQIATPRDLYDRPANRFVARLIGESDFLPERVVADGLELEGFGPVVLPAAGRAAISDAVSVLSRW